MIKSQIKINVSNVLHVCGAPLWAPRVSAAPVFSSRDCA